MAQLKRMGILERKEKQKLEIRKMILEAAMQLFMQEGFENVSIRKIADLIEYSPTTVYLYFKDKNEIFYHLHESGFAKMIEYNANLATISNPLIRLYKMGENYIQFGLEYPQFYDIMFIQKEPMQSLMQQLGEECTQWSLGDNALSQLKAILIECMEKNLIKKGPIDSVALAIWGMVHGLVSLYIRDRLTPLVAKDAAIVVMHNSLNWMIQTLDNSH